MQKLNLIVGWRNNIFYNREKESKYSIELLMLNDISTGNIYGSEEFSMRKSVHEEYLGGLLHTLPFSGRQRTNK